MSELGAEQWLDYAGEPRLCYPKSEADKVLAELIEKNERLANKDITMASETIKDLFEEIRHQKYKRCLSKAKAEQFAVDVFKPYMESALRDTIPELWQQRYKRHQRHLERWLALVDYFKEEA